MIIESTPKKRGSPIAAQTIAAARTARSAKRDSANATVRGAIYSIQCSGVLTLAGVARALQSRGVRTPAGRSTWQAVQVARLVKVIRRNEARALRKLEAASRWGNARF